MFIAALFTIAKMRKLTKYPWTDDWIKKVVVHIYNGIRKNEIKPFVAMWMDLENIILSEVSQKEKEKYHMIPHICGI